MLNSLRDYAQKDMLRFVVCGSVDDGKSTLIGRMLYDSKLVLNDHLAALKADTKKFSNINDEEFDFSLLLDGLQAEREQGITIDVAYRFFSTDKRKFVVIDSPGHIQYTRNMATGASNADLAILLIDAKKGLSEQTKRHSFVVALFGIKDLVIAINKMDAVEYSEDVFNKIKADYLSFIKKIDGFDDLNISFIPISALKGDNLVTKSDNLDWSENGPLLAFLENIQITKKKNDDFVFGVKYVARSSQNQRLFKGKVNSGKVVVGEKIQVLGKGAVSIVRNIKSDDKDVKFAEDGDIVSLILEDEIDISSGDYISSLSTSIHLTDKFNADIIWMDEKHFNANREYLVKFYNNFAETSNLKINYLYNNETLEKDSLRQLGAVGLNQIFNIDVGLTKEVALLPYRANQELGSFILIDKLTNLTVGAGVVKESILRKEVNPISSNILHQNLDISSLKRASMKNQKQCCLWLTGLSGSGKSTIANLLDKTLYALNKHSFVLDGDNVRSGLNSNLGFSHQDRLENIRRVGYVSKLLCDAGLIVISAFISPDLEMREFVKDNIFNKEDFFEIYIDTDIEECKRRDPKSLYKKVSQGEVKNFTGIDSAYEIPSSPDLTLDTMKLSPEESVQKIIEFITKKGYI